MTNYDIVKKIVICKGKEVSMDCRLIALDLDGTLNNSKGRITPRTKQTLIQAQEKGAKNV